VDPFEVGERDASTGVVALTALLAYMLGDITNLLILELAAMVTSGTSAVAIRIVTRGVADYPEAVLDEREERVQKNAYQSGLSSVSTRHREGASTFHRPCLGNRTDVAVFDGSSSVVRPGVDRTGR